MRRHGVHLTPAIGDDALLQLQRQHRRVPANLGQCGQFLLGPFQLRGRPHQVGTAEVAVGEDNPELRPPDGGRRRDLGQLRFESAAIGGERQRGGRAQRQFPDEIPIS